MHALGGRNSCVSMDDLNIHMVSLACPRFSQGFPIQLVVEVGERLTEE